MSKYDFIKNGNTLYWNAPDNGKASGAYKVISAPKEIDEDSIILIASDHSEAEVFPSELFPFGMTMSHKEDFQRWKARYEAGRYDILRPTFRSHLHRPGFIRR